jgi:hypothetical protein
MENEFSKERRSEESQGPAYSTGNRNLFFPNTPTLYVEGHSDKYVLEKFILKDYHHHVKIPNPSGRAHVAKIVKQANVNRQKGGGPVLGIVDRDMEAGDLLGEANLFFYDEDDLEIMIIKSESFEDTLKVIFTDEHWSDFADLRDKLLAASEVVGKLRLFFAINQNSFKLDGSPTFKNALVQSISFDPLNIKINNLFNFVIDSNPKCFRKIERQFVEKCFACFLIESSKANYHRGHDAVEILRCFIKSDTWQVQGNRKNISHRDLHDCLLLPFQWPHFETTEIRRQMIEWMATNKIQRFFRYS